MSIESNPYSAPNSTSPNRESTVTPIRMFKYSYFTSLAVALTVTIVWLAVLVNMTPPAQKRTDPPGVLETAFLIVTTLPSVLTCLGFSGAYCSIFRTRRRIYPAVLFGVASGFVFNAMTAITVIESLFDW
ncbi:MAG: hypothetical protein P8K08_25620 [Fuerstiella sp.]|nr:hypothetical protein [Fuerstiella sp.]